MIPFDLRLGVEGDFLLSLLSKRIQFLPLWTLRVPLIHLIPVFPFNFILSPLDCIEDLLLRTLKNSSIAQNSGLYGDAFMIVHSNLLAYSITFFARWMVQLSNTITILLISIWRSTQSHFRQFPKNSINIVELFVEVSQEAHQSPKEVTSHIRDNDSEKLMLLELQFIPLLDQL